MKNGNTPGFQMPVSISDTPEIITANLRSVKDILLRIPEGALDSKTQDPQPMRSQRSSFEDFWHYYAGI
ncbi:MAG: hypothetical protein U5K79_24615 [Cyclobacteriaceae bacterium]|nr:hypothetical protein [Cyclobacteriaceae bacterium]